MTELYPELTVENALESVLSYFHVLQSEEVPALEALGRVLAEAVRREDAKATRHAMFSRVVVGMRGRKLIVNLPGNPKAVKEGLKIISPVLPRGIEIPEGRLGQTSGTSTNGEL